MGKDKAWHDDNTLWSLFGPMMFTEDLWAGTPAEVDQLVPLLGIEPGTAVLDLCCGPGRHSLEFARRGYHVTGVDRMVTYLEEARERATQEGLEVDFAQGDMRSFWRPCNYDAAISVYTSFGYFAEPVENQRVLENVCRSLVDGGVLLVDVMGKEVLSRIFVPRDWREHEGAVYLQERRVIDAWSKMENRWVLLRGEERHEYTFTHWIYSASELSAMLKSSGFETVMTYGDYAGRPYDHMAKRLVAVARKA